MKTAIISDQWTTRELRAYIREETENMNRRLIEYYASETNPNPVVNQLKMRLLELGSGAKENKPVEIQKIGLGLTNKTKSELLQQARALHEAINVDIYTPQGIRDYDEKEKQQYETFIKNRPALAGMSLDEYHDLVEAFGALGTHVLEEFGYEELAQIYYSTKGVKKLDLVEAVKDIKRETKGEGLDQTQLIDKLRERMVQ